MTVVAAQLGVPLLAPDTQELLGGWATVLGVRLSGDKSRRRKNIWLQLTRNGSNPTLLGKFIFMLGFNLLRIYRIYKFSGSCFMGRD